MSALTSEHSIAHKILKSSLWEYLASWSDRLIGFVSTIILARILIPDDFGVVASASIVTGFFHVITGVGTEQYLIRKQTIEEADLNTAWTLNVLMAIIASIGIYLSAKPVSLFINDERLLLVIQALSIVPLLTGFKNIGTIYLQRAYNYKPQFIVTFIARVTAFIIKLILAIKFQSYWVFIVGEFVEAIIFTIGTYLIQAYRPKFSMAAWNKQWGFSQWVLFKGIFVYLRFKVDNLFIAKFLPIESLGYYSVSKELATLPAGQIVSPIMAPLYVGLSAIQEKPVEFSDKAHKALSVLFIVLFPIAFGTYAVSGNLVTVFLGEKWSEATPVVMILAFTLIPAAFGDFMTKIMMAMGSVKLIFLLEFIFGIITVVSFALLSKGMAIIDFAVLRLDLIIVNTFVVLIVLCFNSPLSFMRIIAFIVAPLIPSILMLMVVLEINQYIVFYNPYIQLVQQVLVGALTYLVCISVFVFLLRNRMNEYQFIWKTFYMSLLMNKV